MPVSWRAWVLLRQPVYGAPLARSPRAVADEEGEPFALQEFPEHEVLDVQLNRLARVRNRACAPLTILLIEFGLNSRRCELT